MRATTSPRFSNCWPRSPGTRTKDYDGEAQTWMDMSQHMYVIADAFADGLAKQFPAKF